MLFFGPSKKKCCVCRKNYRELPEEVDLSDRTAIEIGVAEGRFVCPKCNVSYHGKCGRVGRVNPKSATTTCPKCGTVVKSALPFKLVKRKSTQDDFEDFAALNDPLRDVD